MCGKQYVGKGECFVRNTVRGRLISIWRAGFVDQSVMNRSSKLAFNNSILLQFWSN